MQKFHYIVFFIYIFFFGRSVNLFAQTPIRPIWQVSVGSHEHTSRDEVTHTLRDSEGNVIIIGLVERDSTFGDIMIQKINTRGSLVWKYRYSSNYSLNYDRPVDALLDKANNIYILGIVSNENNLLGGGGYVIKLNEEGQLVWERKLYEQLPSHYSVSSLFFDLDSDENLHFAYTADNFISKPTYLLKIKANNVSLPIRTFPEIFHANIGQPRAKFFSVSKTGVNTFFIEQPNSETNKNSYYTYRITDTTNFAHPIELSDTQQTLIQKGGLDLIGKDSEGSFYILGNTQDNNVRKGFSLFKILNNGKIAYNYYTTDSIEIEAKDMIVRDSSVHITGRFRNNSISFWQVFIQKLDKNGRISKKKWINTPVSDELAEGIYLPEGKLFLTIDNPNARFSISELDTNFNKKWEYFLHKPEGRVYQHHSVIALNIDTILVNGTLKSRKSPTNFFLSENDFYIQAFNPIDISKSIWQYKYSDIGTSLVEDVKAIGDGDGNILVTTNEQVGPSFSAAGSDYQVSNKLFFHVIDTSGQIFKTIDKNFPVEQFFIDKDNNFIIVNSQLFKLDRNGNELARSGHIGVNIRLLHVDTLRNEFYISTNIPEYIIARIDKNLNTISIFSPSDLLTPTVKFFQLKNDPKVYYYDMKLNSYGVSTISLYSNEGLIWKKDTALNNFDVFFSYDISPVDGSLIFCIRGKITKFLLNGQTYTKSLDLDNSESINHVFSMYDGNTIFTGQYLSRNLLLSYNSSFERINRQIINHEYHINYFKIGQFFMRTTDGRVAIFNSKAQSIGLYTNDLLYSVREHNFDKNYNIIVGTTIGQHFFLGSGNANQASGWRWKRGVIAKFSLIDFLRSQITSKTETIPFRNQIDLIAYPNPAVNEVIIKGVSIANLSIIESYNVRIYNTLGQVVASEIWKDINQDLSINVANLTKGVYFIKVSNMRFSNISVLKIIKK